MSLFGYLPRELRNPFLYAGHNEYAPPKGDAEDRALGERHLKATIAFNQQKVADHQRVRAKKKSSESVKYHTDHIEGHRDDIADSRKELVKRRKKGKP